MTKLSKPVATIETLKRLVSNSDNKYATKDSLSTVATTGNYSDLKGIPTALPANGGTATAANKLTVNAGDITSPTYFKDGVPTACTGISVATVTATTTLNIPGGKIWIE